MASQTLGDTLADVVEPVYVTESEWMMSGQRECSLLAHVMRPAGIRTSPLEVSGDIRIGIVAPDPLVFPRALGCNAETR